jgi:alpha-glucosidase
MQTSESIRPDLTPQATGETRRALGDVRECKHDGEAVFIICENGAVAVTFAEGAVVRVRISAESRVDLRCTDAIVAGKTIAPVLTEVQSTIRLSTHELDVVIDKHPFSLTVSHRGEATPFYHLAGVSLGAGKSLELIQPSRPADHFYGLGEKTSFLDKRGESYAMWNSDVYDPHVPDIDALYVSIPFLIHQHPSTVYGVLLDNPGKSTFDMRSRTDAYTIRTETGDADLYIIDGRTLQGTVQRYTGLTGRMALPPKWAIGYHQSRYSYMSADEVLRVAQTFRDKGIPCDALYLDIHYMDGYRVFTFDEERFKEPKALTDALHAMGLKLVTIVDPGVKVDAGYHTYDDGLAQDMFSKRPDGSVYTGDVWPGESAFPDFTSPRVREWWGGEQHYLLEQGVDGIWNDMNEPAIFDGPGKTMPGDIIHDNDGQSGLHESLHNLYGMLMAKASCEGQQVYAPNRRPFVLTRAGYAGIQRYAAVWTGDNRSFWEHMAMAIPMVLNLGLSGVAFAGPDVGGFSHHSNGELLARWTQMGALFPYFRNHSAVDTAYQEPWRFGDEVEQVCKDAIALRYRWLPHLYSLFHQASTTGMPVIRPLVMHYPNDAETSNLSDEFLFGENVLVAPVLQPDARHRLVYLPAGEWYDYWTGDVFGGNQHIIAEAPLDRLPLYVKAGGILPQTTVAPSTAVEPAGPLVIEVFAGSEGTASTFQLYEDDGETLNYNCGKFALLELGWDLQPDRATFHFAYLHHGYTLPWQGLELRIRGLGVMPAEVVGCHQLDVEHLDTTTEAWTWNKSTDTLVVRMAMPDEAKDVVVLPGDRPVL